MLNAKLLQAASDLCQHRLRHLAAAFRREEIMAAPVGVERAEQTVPRHHLTQAAKTRRGALLIHQEGRIELAGGVLHRHHQVVAARHAGQPGVRRGILMQHHSHHRTARPLLAMRRARRRPLQQAGAMQVQLGHRVTQRIVVPLAQLLVEVFDREAAVDITIQAQHPLNLQHRGPPQRRTQATVRQTLQPRIAVTVAPAPKRPLADPKQRSRLQRATTFANRIRRIPS
jgi:hypothetical protein